MQLYIVNTALKTCWSAKDINSSWEDVLQYRQESLVCINDHYRKEQDKKVMFIVYQKLMFQFINYVIQFSPPLSEYVSLFPLYRLKSWGHT